MMRTINNIFLFATAAVALLLSSCTKEKVLGVAEGELVECTLQADVIGTGVGLDIDTKVALNSDGVTPNWESGDKILVLGADKKPVGADGIFTLSSGAGTASGKFTGTVYVGQKAAYAIYPASAATVNDTEPASTAVTGGSLLYTAGDKAGTFKAAVMLGKSSDGTTMAFTNACAVLKFNTGDYGKSGGDPPIKSVKVSASCSSTPAPLAGNFNINWTAVPPTIAAAGTGTVSELTIELPSTLRANEKDIYIPIFPQSAATSMEYEFTNASDAVAEVDYQFTAAIAANTLKNLGTAKELEWVAPAQPDNEIWYQTDDGNIFLKGDRATLNFVGVNIVSHTYENGKGVIRCSGPITEIGFTCFDARFYYPRNYLVSITFPNSLVSIGCESFNYNKLQEVYIPDNVTSIDEEAFEEMQTNIKFVTAKGVFGYGPVQLANGTWVTIKSSCFTKGTLITLANGSKKPVEEITYGDELRVWNFDDGCFDSAKILWLTKEGKRAGHYFRCTFSDGTILNLVGTKHAHRLYNYTDRFFEGTTYITPGKEIFTENGVVKLVSCERVDSLVEYVNLMTDKHINCFAEGVLTSARYNNTYPIDEDMKFIKDGRNKRPYREFKAAGISREWYNGLRLGEQTDSLARIKAYVDNCEISMRDKPAPTFWQRLKTWWRSIFG